jgi:hypothetical protein
MAAEGTAAGLAEKKGYTLEFAEEFDGAALDTSRWLPCHLPHWSSREAAAARYRLADGCLVLRIDADQPAWCPEFDGETRVSSLQTGVYSGPLGSTSGQHRFKSGLEVREAQDPQRLYVPQYGYIETRMKAVGGTRTIVSLWLIGYEDIPERSGEICVCEIKGAAMAEWTTEIGYGIKAWGDPKLQNAFFEDEVLIDGREFHTYAAEWRRGGVDFYLDERKVRTIPLSPAYPMQLMLGIYELAESGAAVRPRLPDPGYPREFVVDYVRVYRPVAADK